MTSGGTVLFVAWDGPDQTYLESLFLPIFAGLAPRGWNVHVLQFRWGPPEVVESARSAAGRYGVPYSTVPILRVPRGATAVTLARGVLEIRGYVHLHGVDVVMPRSTLPAAMTMLARVDRTTKLVFDADGFAPDERVDFAGWSPTGLTYLAFRDVEALATRLAASVVTRTERARSILLARAGAGSDVEKVHVIPNGKDESSFRPADDGARRRLRAEIGVPDDAPLLVYVGSLAEQYYPEAMLELLASVRRCRPDARLLVLTGQVDWAKGLVDRAGLPTGIAIVRRVAADDVPAYLGAADVGIALRKPSFSQVGVSPIKVGEYLLCGLPVLATRGVGDLDVQLAGGEVAHLIDAPTSARLEEAAGWVVEQALPQRARLREACRRRGVDVFGLERCVERYDEALSYAMGTRSTQG